MLNSVLLHLEGMAQAAAVIRLGVSLAAPAEARVRGLTLLDTRHIDSTLQCEAAVYTVAEQTRLTTVQRRQEEVRAALSRACLDAALNFDVRKAEGDPLLVLPQEARFHDLVVTALADGPPGLADSEGLTLYDALALLERGVQPLLIVHPDQCVPQRVLLVYDGTESSGRAIRSFLNLIHLSEAEHRLLAIGRTESQARASLREMADYCLSRRRSLETGCLTGRPRRVLLPYAEKWQADLVVLGSRGNRLWQRLCGNAATDVWRRLPCGLFIAT